MDEDQAQQVGPEDPKLALAARETILALEIVARAGGHQDLATNLHQIAGLVMYVGDSAERAAHEMLARYTEAQAIASSIPGTWVADDQIARAVCTQTHLAALAHLACVSKRTQP